VGNGYLTVLVAALLLVGHLILDLDGAGARLDHLLGQQVGRFGVTETGVDVGDNGHNVSLEVVDLVLHVLGLDFVTSFAGVVQGAEQAAQFAGVSLAQEGVQLFDQAGHGSLLVHRLVGQRTEVGAQGRDHPAGQVQIALVGIVEVLLDGDQLLLTDKAVPAAQGLGVLAAVSVVLFHVLAHDRGGVFGDIQTGLEAVLGLHTSGVFGVDGIPGATVLGTELGDCVDVLLDL